MHLSGLIAQNDSVNVTKTRVAAIIRHDIQTDIPNMLMRAYSFNKNKITRSFILISFIYSLKI